MHGGGQVQNRVRHRRQLPLATPTSPGEALTRPRLAGSQFGSGPVAPSQHGLEVV